MKRAIVGLFTLRACDGTVASRGAAPTGIGELPRDRPGGARRRAGRE
jgi:hypothetical protein